MPLCTVNTQMTKTPNNLLAPPNAAGGAPQLTADPPPEGINKNQHPKKRAKVCIATLNVNGAAMQAMGYINKWMIINNTIKNEKLAIIQWVKKLSQCLAVL